jgi:hypothetical protein
MCHHIEGRDWRALREDREEPESAGVEGAAARIEVTDASEADDRLPPIQSSD